MKTRQDVSLGQCTHVGMVRSANEDHLGYWESEDEEVLQAKGRLLIVCDGMGGHNGGGIASHLAVQTIIEEYQATPSDDLALSLRTSIEAANSRVFEEAQEPDNRARLQGMGTTVTALVQRGEEVYFAQVGDSRAYLIRGEAIKQMTKDHSLVQQLVDEGLLEESEKEHHPDKNVILRSLGVKPQVEVDISCAPLAPGDTYLLCSDGLSSLVPAGEILQIVLKAAGDPAGGTPALLQEACETLVERANEYGGHDNITVQIMCWRRPDTSLDAAPPESQPPPTPALLEASSKAPAPSPTSSSPPQAELPPHSSPPPSRLRLIVGVALGLALGVAGGIALDRQFLDAPAARRARDFATSRVRESSDPKAQDLLRRGERALEEGRYSDAQAAFEAAAALADAAGH